MVWRLVEKLWNFFELPVTTGTFPGGRGGDEGGEGGGSWSESVLTRGILYVEDRTAFCMVDYVAAMLGP